MMIRPPARDGSARRAFTLLELIVVIVVLALLAALAIPTFGRVVERSRDARTLATLAAVARDTQALAAFDSRDAVNDEDVRIAASETAAVLVSAGVTASSHLTAVKSSTAEPGALELVYTHNTSAGAVVLSLLSGPGRVCVLGATRTALGVGTCGPARTDGRTSVEVLSEDPLVLPPLATPQAPPVTTPPTTNPDTNPPVAVPAVDKPAAPTALVTSESAGKVTLSWVPATSTFSAPVATQAVKRASGTTEELARAAVPTTLANVTAATSSRVDSITVDGWYCYSVESVNSAGTSAPAGPACREVVIGPRPGAFTVSATIDNVTGVGTVTWTAAERGTSYTVRHVGDAWSSAATTGLSYTTNAFSVGTTTTYYVVASNAGGTTRTSNNVPLTRLTPPSTVTGLKVTGTDGARALSWSATASSATTGFVVSRCALVGTTCSGPTTVIANLTAAERTLTVGTGDWIYFVAGTGPGGTGAAASTKSYASLPDPLHAWDFDEAPGATNATDSGTNPQPLLLSSASTSYPTATTLTAGTGGVVTLGNPSLLANQEGTSLGFPDDGKGYARTNGLKLPAADTTVSFTVQCAKRAAFQGFFSYASSTISTSGNGFLVGAETSTGYLSLSRDGGGWIAPVVVCDGTPHQISIALTTGVRVEYYIDGVKSSTVTTDAKAVKAIPSNGWLYLGQDQDTLGGTLAATQGLRGYLDQLRVYPRALTADEISSLVS